MLCCKFCYCHIVRIQMSLLFSVLLPITLHAPVYTPTHLKIFAHTYIRTYILYVQNTFFMCRHAVPELMNFHFASITSVYVHMWRHVQYPLLYWWVPFTCMATMLGIDRLCLNSRKKSLAFEGNSQDWLRNGIPLFLLIIVCVIHM